MRICIWGKYRVFLVSDLVRRGIGRRGGDSGLCWDLKIGCGFLVGGGNEREDFAGGVFGDRWWGFVGMIVVLIFLLVPLLFVVLVVVSYTHYPDIQPIGLIHH